MTNALRPLPVDEFVRLAAHAGLEVSRDDLEQLERRRLIQPYDSGSFSRLHLYLLAVYFDAIRCFRHPWAMQQSSRTIDEVKQASRDVSEVMELLDSETPTDREAETVADLAVDIERFLASIDPFGPIGDLLDLLRSDVRDALRGVGRLYTELHMTATALAGEAERMGAPVGASDPATREVPEDVLRETAELTAEEVGAVAGPPSEPGESSEPEEDEGETAPDHAETIDADEDTEEQRDAESGDDADDALTEEPFLDDDGLPSAEELAAAVEASTELSEASTEAPGPESEPSESEELSEPSEPEELSEPSEPEELSEPSEPEELSEPSEPEELSEPFETEEFSEPEEPSEPEETSEPEEPSEPEESAEPSERPALFEGSEPTQVSERRESPVHEEAHVEPEASEPEALDDFPSEDTELTDTSGASDDTDETLETPSEAEEVPPEKPDNPFAREAPSGRTKALLDRLEEIKAQRSEVEEVDEDATAEEAQDAEELEMKVNELNLLRQELIQNQDWGGLVALYEERMNLFDEPADRQQVYLTLATLYELKLGDDENAFRSFDEAFDIEVRDGQFKTLDHLKKIGGRDDLYDRYSSWLEQQRANATDPEVRERLQRDLSEAHQDAGHPQRAFLSYAAYLAEQPERIEPQTIDFLDELSIEVDDEELIGFFDDILEHEAPDAVKTLVAIRAGSFFLGTNEPHHAIRHFRLAFEHDPTSDIAFSNLARLYEREENWGDLRSLIAQKLQSAEGEEAERLRRELGRVVNQETASSEGDSP